MLVLAEEGHEAPAQRGKIGRRGRPARDQGPGAAALPHPASQRQLVAVLPDEVGQVGQLGFLEKTGRQLEHSLDISLPRPGANHSGARLAAQQQVERLSEDRLARPGLARERGQAASRAQLGALDEQEVLDSQLEEHRSGVPARPDGAARN